MEFKRIYAMISDMADMNGYAAKNNIVVPYYIMYEDGYYPYGFHLKGESWRFRDRFTYPYTHEQFENTSAYEVSRMWYKSGMPPPVGREVYDITLDEFNDVYGGNIRNFLTHTKSLIDDWTVTPDVLRVARIILPMTMLVYAFKNLDIRTVHQYDFQEAQNFEEANEMLVNHFSNQLFLAGTELWEGSMEEFLLFVLRQVDAGLAGKIHSHVVVAEISERVYPDKKMWGQFVKALTNEVNRNRRESLSIPAFYNQVSEEVVAYFMKSMFMTDVIMFQREWYSIHYFLEISARHANDEVIGMALLYGSAHDFEKWKTVGLSFIEPDSVRGLFPERYPKTTELMEIDEYPLDFYTKLFGLYLMCQSVITDKDTLISFEATYKRLEANYRLAFDRAIAGYKKNLDVKNTALYEPLGFDFDELLDDVMDVEDDKKTRRGQMNEGDAAILDSFDDFE